MDSRKESVGNVKPKSSKTSMYKLIANKNWLTMLEILIDMNAKGLNYLYAKFQVNKKTFRKTNLNMR